MRMTAFEDVSLRALMLLSAVDASGPLATRAIAEGVGTPYNHVSKAVLRLRDLGLIEATRGRAGGVRLSEAGRNATIGSVLRALDTRPDLPECEGGAAGDCPLLPQCGLRSALRRAREAFYRELDAVRITSLPNSRQMSRVFLQLGLAPAAASFAPAGPPPAAPPAAAAAPTAAESQA
ncbi:RrF2 family transcriptional regulator [Sinomonas susongensis]|uniref:RrF2 family transcriptional regulator n=1 Tax=Sinomonas susongensis TaxID=1324851 RepID=UPI001109A5E3|nr:Rrf2 family transcriptional regulator [Sinomonas susongensis]